MANEIAREIEDKLYEAAIVPDLWPNVLDRLIAFSHSRHAVVFHVSDDHLRWIANDENKAYIAEFLEEGWSSNEIFRWHAQNQYMGFANESMVLGDVDLSKYDLYTKYLWPRGLGWTCASTIPVPNGDRMVIAFERIREADPFDSAAVNQLDQLRPHMARAMLVAGRLQLERAQSALETLRTIGIPAAVIDRKGVVKLTNSAFDSLSAPIFSRAFGRIGFTNPSARRLFDEALAALKQSENSTMRSIPIPASEPHPAFVLHIIPIVLHANDIFSNVDALIVFTPVTAQASVNLSLLHGLYDLTPSESRVASALLQGKSIEIIAEENRNSRETVRTHVKKIFAKTGTGRQSELVSLLSGVARVSP